MPAGKHTANLWDYASDRFIHSNSQATAEGAEQRKGDGIVVYPEITERLPGTLADDEARIVMALDGPWRREAARGRHDGSVQRSGCEWWLSVA